MLEPEQTEPGKRYYRLWDDGLHGTILYVTVVRVNRKSVTVLNERGETCRVNMTFWRSNYHPATGRCAEY